MARMRCGNLWRGNRYWMRDNEKRCRLCGKSIEDMEHVVYECEEGLKWRRSLGELMDERGSGIEWLRKILEIRKGKEGKDMERRNGMSG